MNPCMREDTRQVLSDQYLVESLPDEHWAREILITLIQYGVIRIGYYRKQRHMSSAQYTKIQREAEAPYAAQRQKRRN